MLDLDSYRSFQLVNNIIICTFIAYKYISSCYIYDCSNFIICPTVFVQSIVNTDKAY